MELSEKDRKKLERNATEDSDFSKAVNECIKKGFNVDKTLKIGTTPFCLRIAGAEAIPLMILGRDLRNCVSGEKTSKHNKHEHTEKHSISIKTVKKFPEALRNPMCICTGNRPNSLLVISDLLDQNGENIVFPIYLSVKGLNTNINRIQTVYGKKNIQAFILRMEQENKLIAVNKEKIDTCFVNQSNATIGLQLPKVENIINLDNSIAYSLANVKYPEEKNLQENQNDKGDVSPMTEQQMLAQIEALRKEFEGKFSAMEEKFNNLSSEVQTINKFVAAMTEAQGFEQTMSEIESVTKQLTACENAVFYCYDNGADKFFSGSGDERNYEQAADNIRGAFDSGEIISSGQSAVIPLVSAKGETLGVIAAEKEGGFTAADYDYFKSGSQITGTVELALNKEFEHQGRVTDELTGLKNRQGLNEYVADTVRRNINSDKPVNIVMCDIDHFKSINDTYGHDAGDTVLRNVAKILQDGTRSGSDCAFRMGGEEMVLMLNCEPEKAAEIAERLRSEVESAVHTVMQDGQEKEISVTISMGVHQMKPETEMTKENARAVFDSEFKSADDLVYEAKESGRNKVVTDISETVIEFDSYISDEIPVYDIETDKDISDEILTSGGTEISENETPQNYSLFIMNEGEQAYFIDENVTDVNELLKRFAESGGFEGKYNDFLKDCTEISEVEFAELEQSTKTPPAFAAEFDLVEREVTVWDNDKIAHMDFDTVAESIQANGTVNFEYREFAESNDTPELVSEHIDMLQSLNDTYSDFMYHNSIFNEEHINFVTEHGELPDNLNSGANRATVSEYINAQLDSGNITPVQREELTSLQQEIRDFEESLFCEVVDEIMEKAAEISEISQETREQEQEKSQENER